jgi:VCBS repeat-containing protein
VQYTAPANAAPVATNDTYTTAEDNALTISAPGVLTNDSDANADPITAVLVSNPTHGTLNLNTNGAFVYMPSLNYTGLDTFTYRASDGALTSSVATVTITITPVSDAPVASNDTYTTARDMALTNSAPGVLVNDSDPDGDVLSTVLVTGPAHGTLNLNTNGAFVYTPSLNYTGLDTFTYRASDRALTSSVATVTITITPPPPSPLVTGPRLQTNQFVFNFVGEAGHSYTVEYNANLNTSNWTTHLVFPAPAQKTNFTVLDALGTNRFFRVRAD